MLADLAGVRDRKKLFRKPELAGRFKRRSTHKCRRAFGHRASICGEHGPVVLGLRGGNGTVGISHDRRRDSTAFQDHVGLYAKERRIPDAEIRELSGFNRPDIIRNALRDGGVDRVLRYIAPCPEIIVVALLLRKSPKLLLHFVGCLPGSNDYLANATHRLTI